MTEKLTVSVNELDHVKTWAAKRLETLRGCTGQPVRDPGFSDDERPGVLRGESGTR